MSRPRNPSGTRRPRTYVRNGKTVHDRGGRIKRRQAPKRRLNAAARRRAQRKPMLAGAAGLLGLGALDAILNGRWGGFLVLGGLAVGLAVTHYGWQWHKNRQARKPAKPKPPKADLAAEVRAQQQAENEAELYWAGLSTHNPKQEAAAEAGSQSAQAVVDVESSRRPTGSSRAGAGPRRSDYTDQTAAASVKREPASHEEWQTLYGRRCDCTKCRAKRKAEKAEKVSLR